MPRFKYEGRDKFGKKSGTISGTSKQDAVRSLHDKGIRVITINEVPETFLTKDIAVGHPVKLREFVIFLRQFATLIKAGVTIVDSINILAHQTSSKPLQKALLEVGVDLREGIPLSTATTKHKRIFTNLFTNMIRVGEVGGNLDDTLENLAGYYEKQNKTRQKVKSAMAYPAVVGIIAVVVVIFLLVSVVPTFVDMFADFGAELPAITKFVLHASVFMQKFWWLVVLLGLVIYLLFIFLKRKQETRFYLDYALLKMPIFGKLIQKAVLARMTRTLSSMLNSSVPILQALSVVETIVENEVIAKVVKQSRQALEQGKSMTEPMKKHWAFPPLITHMIAIGESTGSLDEMLGKVANFYEDEVDNATDQLKSLIEPLMIVFLSGIVGTIVTAILVPMFDIFNQIQ